MEAKEFVTWWLVFSAVIFILMHLILMMSSGGYTVNISTLSKLGLIAAVAGAGASFVKSKIKVNKK